MKQFGTLVGTAALVIAVIGGVTGASLALQASEPAQQEPATVDFRPASGEATLADPVTTPAPAEEPPAAVTRDAAPAEAPAPKAPESAGTTPTRSTDDTPSAPARTVKTASAPETSEDTVAPSNPNEPPVQRVPPQNVEHNEKDPLLPVTESNFHKKPEPPTTDGPTPVTPAE